jgi:hypothetical protein
MTKMMTCDVHDWKSLACTRKNIMIHPFIIFYKKFLGLLLCITTTGKVDIFVHVRRQCGRRRRFVLRTNYSGIQI